MVDVLPTLYDLKRNLTAAADDEPDEQFQTVNVHPTPAVIRIASHASVLLIDKYINLIWQCDIYIIAMGKFSITAFSLSKANSSFK